MPRSAPDQGNLTQGGPPIGPSAPVLPILARLTGSSFFIIRARRGGSRGAARLQHFSTWAGAHLVRASTTGPALARCETTSRGTTCGASTPPSSPPGLGAAVGEPAGGPTGRPLPYILRIRVAGGRESVGSVPYRRSSGSRRSPHMSAGSRSAVGLSARSATSRQPTAPVRGSAASALPRIAPYSASPHRRAALSARFCTVWGAFRSLFDHQTGHFSPPFRRPPAARRADCRLYRASVRAVGLQSGSRGPPPRRARVRIAAKLVFLPT